MTASLRTFKITASIAGIVAATALAGCASNPTPPPAPPPAAEQQSYNQTQRTAQAPAEQTTQTSTATSGTISGRYLRSCRLPRRLLTQEFLEEYAGAAMRCLAVPVLLAHRSKSDISIACLISMISFPKAGQRFAQPTASSFGSTSIIQ